MPADATGLPQRAPAPTAGGSLGGLENVDLWIGGLAEEIMPFGGMLGSTFNFVFEVQMEKLQNGDRFYYLQRLDGLHLFGEMENNSFAAMIMRNTDATHLPSDVFSTPGLILEVDRRTGSSTTSDGDGRLESDDPTSARACSRRWSSATTRPRRAWTPTTCATPATSTSCSAVPSRPIPSSPASVTTRCSAMAATTGSRAASATTSSTAAPATTSSRTAAATTTSRPATATTWSMPVRVSTWSWAAPGQDFIFLGTDMGSEVFAGEGNDFIYGNKNAERILGNEGNDWIETGTFDGAPGDNFDEIFAQDGVDGHDVFLGDGGFDEFIAEGGDDIMVGSLGRGKMVGMSGFDWATYKDNAFAVDADFTRGIVFDENPQPPQFGTLDAYESVEGLSGSSFNDILDRL